MKRKIGLNGFKFLKHFHSIVNILYSFEVFGRNSSGEKSDLEKFHFSSARWRFVRIKLNTQFIKGSISDHVLEGEEFILRRYLYRIVVK